jgi:hypothetical protein
VRNKILAEVSNAPPFSDAHVYVASVTRRSERHARDDCFRSLTVDALELHAARIVIEKPAVKILPIARSVGVVAFCVAAGFAAVAADGHFAPAPPARWVEE